MPSQLKPEAALHLPLDGRCGSEGRKITQLPTSGPLVDDLPTPPLSEDDVLPELSGAKVSLPHGAVVPPHPANLRNDYSMIEEDEPTTGHSEWITIRAVLPNWSPLEFHMDDPFEELTTSQKPASNSGVHLSHIKAIREVSAMTPPPVRLTPILKVNETDSGDFRLQHLEGKVTPPRDLRQLFGSWVSKSEPSPSLRNRIYQEAIFVWDRANLTYQGDGITSHKVSLHQAVDEWLDR
jgi:hypothetical protein